MSAAAPAAPEVTYSSAAGRWILLVSILGSGVAGLDASVVNVALPTIGTDLGAGLADLQWTVTAYTLTLASFILVGGSLGDRFGRRRVFLVGVVWFALASLLCGLAPNAGVLIGARALQGVGGALLTPGSLAMIQASFAPGDRAKAVGAWSGLSGVATAVGPFLGGWLVESISWRWIFFINLPVAAVVVVLALRHVPETRADGASERVDLAGAALGALALAGVTYALIEGPETANALPWLLGAAGLVAGAAFLLVEARSRAPMLPLGIFRSRQFSATNAVTFLVYGGFGAVFFLLVIQLQVVSGYSPIAAGTSILPVTVVMLLLSSRSGALASRIGPRLQMSVGPVVVGLALLLMARVGPDASYLVDVLPAVALMGLGLAIVVAPLTSTALSSAPEELAGLASGVNNAVARAAGLVAVAVLPALVGISGEVSQDPAAFDSGFSVAMVVSAAVVAAGGLLAAVTIRNDVLDGDTPDETAAESTQGHGDQPPAPGADRHHSHCGVGAPPMVTSTPGGHEGA